MTIGCRLTENYWVWDHMETTSKSPQCFWCSLFLPSTISTIKTILPEKVCSYCMKTLWWWCCCWQLCLFIFLPLEFLGAEECCGIWFFQPLLPTNMYYLTLDIIEERTRHFTSWFSIVQCTAKYPIVPSILALEYIKYFDIEKNLQWHTAAPETEHFWIVVKHFM